MGFQQVQGNLLWVSSRFREISYGFPAGSGKSPMGFQQVQGKLL
jgi:hypothetical protein